MKFRLSRLSSTLGFGVMLLVASTAAWADQLILKNGQEYSGKFVRGDSSVVEFRTAGKIESFKTTEIAQIIFKQPELDTPVPERSVRPAPPTRQPAEQAPPQPLSQQTPPQVAPAQTITLPPGTPLTIRTSEPIDTERNKLGYRFAATLAEPLAQDGQIIAPQGTEVTGKIAYSQESGRIAGKSELVLELTEIKVNGRTYALRTSDYVEVGASRGKRTAAAAGGGAAIGAIIGAIAGGGKGAAVGAATGAAVGTGAQVLTKGEVLKIPAETILEFKLQAPLILDVP